MKQNYMHYIDNNLCTVISVYFIVPFVSEILRIYEMSCSQYKDEINVLNKHKQK